MKTILHVSLGLMLLAAGAGLSDFLRLFRSGEIDKIYSQADEPGEAPPPATHPPHAASFNQTEIAEVELVNNKQVNTEEHTVLQKQINDEQEEQALLTVPVEDAVTTEPTVIAVDTMPISFETTTSDDDSLVAVEEAYDLNIRRFSRAALPEKHIVYKKLSEIKKEEREKKEQEKN